MFEPDPGPAGNGEPRVYGQGGRGAAAIEERTARSSPVALGGAAVTAFVFKAKLGGAAVTAFVFKAKLAFLTNARAHVAARSSLRCTSALGQLELSWLQLSEAVPFVGGPGC